MTRGGFRSGSGRKSSWNNSDTQLIRVPRIFASRLLDIARRLDTGAMMELSADQESASDNGVAEAIDPDTLVRMAQEILTDEAIVQSLAEQDAARRALSVFIDRLMQ